MGKETNTHQTHRLDSHPEPKTPPQDPRHHHAPSLHPQHTDTTSSAYNPIPNLAFAHMPELLSYGGAGTAMAPLQLQQALAFAASDFSSVSAPLPLAASSIAKKDDCLPQWGLQETTDFIAIRAKLEKDFTQTKRIKNLWESIASKMKEKGYRRSTEQCKCKWKNLVNRYKGKETLEPDNGSQCPFFDELHAIFTERAKRAPGLLLQSESGARMKAAGRNLNRSSEDFSDEEVEDEDASQDEQVVKCKKRKTDKERQRTSAEKCRANRMQEVLEDFFQQHQRLELQWRENMERREEERRIREQECRNAMESLENERIVREQHWRERDDQRRAREEVRAEKRDALFDAILSRLAREDL